MRRTKALTLAAAALAMMVGGMATSTAAEPQAKKAGSPRPQAASLVGKDLSPWRAPTGDWLVVGGAKLAPLDERLLAAEPGSGAILNGKKGVTANLLSNTEHGDVAAHVEFMVPVGSNSGVYFQGRYEIQVFDSWKVEHPKYGDCGGIYQRWGDQGGYEGHAPRVNASLAPGRWQTFDVVFRAPRFDAAGKKIANAKFVKLEVVGSSPITPT